MRTLLLAALLLAAAGCGHDRAKALTPYHRVALVGNPLPDDAARARSGLAGAGLTVVDEAEAARAPEGTLACDLRVLDGPVRSACELRLTDYASHDKVWWIRCTRRMANSRGRCITAACDGLASDIGYLRYVAER